MLRCGSLKEHLKGNICCQLKQFDLYLDLAALLHDRVLSSLT
jgi:hypothetical protein